MIKVSNYIDEGNNNIKAYSIGNIKIEIYPNNDIVLIVEDDDIIDVGNVDNPEEYVKNLLGINNNTSTPLGVFRQRLLNQYQWSYTVEDLINKMMEIGEVSINPELDISWSVSKGDNVRSHATLMGRGFRRIKEVEDGTDGYKEYLYINEDNTCVNLIVDIDDVSNG